MTTPLLRLGTRKSLLAWAQSSWVAHEIERLNPSTRVELVGIETRGDRVLDVPLNQIEGKEFFVAELDDALRGGRVDLNVHSMKDLSLDRPSEFTLAATPIREDPRDVIFFAPGILERIAKGKPLRVGTSSPRRLENIPSFLRRALPKVGQSPPQFLFVEIRGNVNTRLGRIQLPENDNRSVDAVVLALAGISRLWSDPKGQEQLKPLLLGARLMVLPLCENPTAAAQGALAVECRTTDASTREILARIHDPSTATLVARERSLLAKWGGGCHQRFGATVSIHATLGSVLFKKGVTTSGEVLSGMEWNAPPPPSAPCTAWDGHFWRSEGVDLSLPTHLPELSGESVFIAHWRAVRDDHPSSVSALSGARIWTSGPTSWFKLAEKGLWVEGCAENLGFDWIQPLLQKPCLGLSPLRDWHILTHRSASADWLQTVSDGMIHRTYELSPLSEPPEAINELSRATEVFVSSISQFERIRSHLAKSAQLSCGPGRTASALRKLGHQPKVFPTIHEWRNWLPAGSLSQQEAR